MKRETGKESRVSGRIRCNRSFLFQDSSFAGREERRFFDHGGGEMFGVIHYPAGAPKNIGILMCSPFLDEYMESQGFLVNYARYLATLGYPVFRFDYRGCGESDGAWEKFSIPEYLSDIRRAVEYFSAQVGIRFIGLFGVRLGASLALMTLSRENSAEFAILCNPVLHGEAYVRDILRLHIAEQMLKYLQVRTGMRELLDTIQSGGEVHVLGYTFNSRNHAALRSVDLREHISAIRKPVAIFAFRNPTARNGDFRELAEELRNNSPLSMIREVDSPAFWKPGPRLIRRIPELYETAPDWIVSLGLPREPEGGGESAVFSEADGETEYPFQIRTYHPPRE